MKNINYIFIFVLVFSCTSNTILKKPENLIHRDTMTLLIKDIFIALSAKDNSNLSNKRNINYMPFVYEKYKIDSLRFKNSNAYYVSKIDLYEEIFTEVKKMISKEIENLKDTLRQDSILKLSKKQKK